MQPCSASTKRPPSRRSIARTAYCRCRPVAPESLGFEYKRNGTLSRFAALDTATGEVIAKAAPQHTSDEFVRFLNEVVASRPKGREIHVISSHKTQAVHDFLKDHPKVALRFTSAYSSWLNQVENWFARIQRNVISRGIFSSVKNLDKKIMKYIRKYKNAKPLKWKHSDPSRRITADSFGFSGLE